MVSFARHSPVQHPLGEVREIMPNIHTVFYIICIQNSKQLLKGLAQHRILVLSNMNSRQTVQHSRTRPEDSSFLFSKDSSKEPIIVEFRRKPFEESLRIEKPMQFLILRQDQLEIRPAL
jgi:hypothetical protein